MKTFPELMEDLANAHLEFGLARAREKRGLKWVLMREALRNLVAAQTAVEDRALEDALKALDSILNSPTIRKAL